MSDFIMTPDGPQMIMSVEDIRQIIDKYIGMEFANYIADMIYEMDAVVAYEEARATTDADAIAGENDELRTQLMDAADIIEEMLEDEKLTKAKMISKLNVMGQDMRKNL